MPNGSEIELDYLSEDGNFDWQGLLAQTQSMLESAEGSEDLGLALADTGITVGLNFIPVAGTALAGIFQLMGGLDGLINWGSSADPEKEEQLMQVHLYDYVDDLLKKMNKDNMRKTLNLIDYRANWFRSHYRNNRAFHANAPDTKELMENMSRVADEFYALTFENLTKELAKAGIQIKPIKKDHVFKTHPKTPWYINQYSVNMKKSLGGNPPGGGNGNGNGNTKPPKGGSEIGQVVAPIAIGLILKRLLNF